jgi:LysM repeat protein
MRRRNIPRFGFVLLLALMLVIGCTRAKSSPPEPTTTETGAQEATQPPEAGPSSTPSGQDVIAGTATAWAIETATAVAESPPGTSQATQAPTLTGQPEAADGTGTPAPSATPVATQLPSGQEKTHTVKAGENLFRIALQYNLTYQTLAAYNGIANPNYIVVGQKLKIPTSGAPVQPPKPAARTHVVRAGENLFRIALQYNMLYTELARANGLGYPYTIYVGQRLVIP